MEVQENCGLLIKQIHDAIGRRLNNSLRESGLTNAQLGTLIVLEHTADARLKMKELEKVLHVSQPTAAGIVDRLEEKGLVRTEKSPEDKRIRLVEITPEGLKKARHEHDVLLDAQQLMLQGITKADQEKLQKMLLTMRENLA